MPTRRTHVCVGRRRDGTRVPSAGKCGEEDASTAHDVTVRARRSCVGIVSIETAQKNNGIVRAETYLR